MSDSQTSYEEHAASAAKRYKRNMHNSFITAGAFAILAVTSVYSLANFHLPTYAFVLLIIVGPISVLVSLVSLFDAGRFFEIRDYEPRAWMNEGKYRELSEDFAEFAAGRRAHADYLFSEWVYLFSFFRSRSPELLAEFKAWKEEQSQPSAEDKKEEN